MTEPQPKVEDLNWRASRDGQSVIVSVDGATRVLARAEHASPEDMAVMAAGKQLYALLDEVVVDLKRDGKKTSHIDKVLDGLRERVPQ